MDKKFFDFVAGMFLIFNVDWTHDFPDDEYCLEPTPVVVTGKKQRVAQPAAAAGRAG